jgi:hypothetical protein
MNKDLRALALEFALRPSVKRARGHFIAIPERYQGEVPCRNRMTPRTQPGKGPLP